MRRSYIRRGRMASKKSKVGKEVRRDAKQIKRTGKTLAKSVKKIAKVFSPAKKKPVVKKSSKINKPLQGHSKYTLQELASSKSRDLGLLFSNIEQNADKLDKLKKPGQRWAFRMYNRYSVKVYRSMRQVLGYIGYLASADDLHPDFIDNVSIMVEGSEESKYHEKVVKRRKAQARVNKNIEERVAESVGLEKESRKKNRFEIYDDLLGLANSYREKYEQTLVENARKQELQGERIAQLESTIAKFMEQFGANKTVRKSVAKKSKATKKASKQKSSKAVAKKKTVAKKKVAVKRATKRNDRKGSKTVAKKSVNKSKTKSKSKQNGVASNRTKKPTGKRGSKR